MNLLLDTHVLLWWLHEPKKIQEPVKKQIAEAEHVSVSVASIWEIAIKVGNNKLHLPKLLSHALEAESFTELAITARHAHRVSELKLLHRDPFDRMLVAQSIIEGLTLVTADRMLGAYGVSILNPAR